MESQKERILMSEKGNQKGSQETLRDTELLKVQIYSDGCHTSLTIRLSFVLGVLIGFLVLFYTLFFENAISAQVFWVTLGSITVACFSYLASVVRAYNDEFKKISGMIEMIKQGKELPTLEKLGRKVRTNDSKTSEQKENGNEAKEHKLWYLGITTSLCGSLLIACAVQCVYSSGLVRVFWTLFYILAGIFFFGTSQKAGKIMNVSRYYIRGLQIAMITIVISGLVGILLTEILLK